jgi:hypothetical protein
MKIETDDYNIITFVVYDDDYKNCDDCTTQYIVKIKENFNCIKSLIYDYIQDVHICGQGYDSEKDTYGSSDEYDKQMKSLLKKLEKSKTIKQLTNLINTHTMFEGNYVRVTIRWEIINLTDNICTYDKVENNIPSKRTK